MSYQKLEEHFGHRLCIVSYGEGAQYAVECEDCRAVVISRDRPDGRFPILHGAYAPECETCGACCTSPHGHPGGPSPNVCIFSDAELARLPSEVRERVIEMENGALALPTVRGAAYDCCAFLEGEVGIDASCSLHGVKPTECRWFLPGSQACRDARRHRGLPLDKDPTLRRDMREGNTGAVLLEMRLYLNEIPNSIARPDRVAADHYSRENDRQLAAAKETS